MLVKFGELKYKKKQNRPSTCFHGYLLVGGFFCVVIFCVFAVSLKTSGVASIRHDKRAYYTSAQYYNSTEMRVNDAIHHGSVALREGHFLEAERYLHQALDLDSKFGGTRQISIRCLLGLAQLQVGNFKEAKKNLLYVLKNNPNDYDALFAMAQLAFWTHNLITAKNYIDQLKSGFPRNLDVTELDRAIELGFNEQNQIMFSKSLEILTQPIANRHIDASLKLSAAKHEINREPSMRLPGNPPDPVKTAPVIKGRVENKNKRLDDLIAEADRKSHSPSSFFQAELIYRNLVCQNPRSVVIWTKLAAVQAFQNKYDRAEQSYQMALKIAPQDFDARLGLANLYIWQNKYNQAQELLNSLENEFTENPDVLLAQAQLLRNIGDYKKAITILNHLLSLAPKNAESWIVLGDCQRAILNDASAKDAYNQALKFAPDNPNLINRLHADIRKRWRMDINVGFSSLTNAYDNWGEGGIGLSYRLDEKNTVIGRLNIVRRFGKTDRQLEIGLVREVLPKTWTAIGISWTPQAKISSHYKLRASLSRIVNEGEGTLGPLTLILKGKNAWYNNGSVKTIALGARQSFFHDRLALFGEWVNIFDQHSVYYSGYNTRIDGILWNILHLNLGYSDMMEASGNQMISTTSLFSGVAVDIDLNLQLGLNWARDNRKNAYRRHLYDVALVRKF